MAPRLINPVKVRQHFERARRKNPGFDLSRRSQNRICVDGAQTDKRKWEAPRVIVATIPDSTEKIYDPISDIDSTHPWAIILTVPDNER
jgi:hypothetical protein